jgi:hypothetical protein
MRLVLPARLAGDVAPVIRAWAAWTAERANLPKRLRRRLLPELDGELREFPAVLAPRAKSRIAGTSRICPTTSSPTTPDASRHCNGGTSPSRFTTTGRRAPKPSTRPSRRGAPRSSNCGWPDAESRETSGRPTRLWSRNCGQANRRE